MIYREPLPEGCPPGDASEIISPRTVYRMVRSVPPTEDDFRSQRADNPDKVFSNVPECQVRGLSVFDNHRAVQRQLRKPRMRGLRASAVTLNRGAGHIKHTGRGDHYTWWPLADFDILSNCRVVGYENH